VPGHNEPGRKQPGHKQPGHYEPGRKQPRRGRPRASQQYRAQPPELVRLVSRLMFARAAVTCAIGLAYLRRNITWLLFASMVAVAVALLAGLFRSGTHAARVAAVTGESTLTLIGLVRVTTGDYPGGTLLAIATLGAGDPSGGRPGLRPGRWPGPAGAA
jgi:hypothetical protein